MNRKIKELSEKIFHKQYEELGEREKKVAHHLIERIHISKNLGKDYSEQLTLGQRLADMVTDYGGSWPYLILFGVVMIIWVLMNSYVLAKFDKIFDPYPYILLNLFLSMISAIQAPIILMSKRRQSYKDRLRAENDYEINLKAELEIMALHEKIDLLREKQWGELILIQQEQLKLLTQLIGEAKKNH